MASRYFEPAAMRVQKFLSQAGVCSRRTAEDWMREGRVKINGHVCRELGAKVAPERDTVEVDGERVQLVQSLIYLLMNKPGGVITSLHDPEGRDTIADLLPRNMPRVWPVGRLDWNTEGVLLVTNDGKLTNLLTHPSHDVTKHYAVKVRGLFEDDSPALARMREGLDLGSGEITRPAHVKVTGHTDRNTWMEIIIAEGKNRQIRRMCEAINAPVMKLRRLAIGPLTIDGLASGTYRSLLHEEVEALYEALSARVPDAAQPSERQLQREREQLDRHGRPKVRNTRGNSARNSSRGGSSSSRGGSSSSSSSSRSGSGSRGGSSAGRSSGGARGATSGGRAGGSRSGGNASRGGRKK